MNHLTLPEWYHSEPNTAAADSGRNNRKADIPVRRALASIGEMLATLLTESPCSGSFLGAVDTRMKIAGFFTLLVACTFLRGLSSLLLIFAMAVITAISVRMPAKRLFSVWIGAPLFSLAIILPAATNLVTPGNEVLRIWHLSKSYELGPVILPQSLYFTSAGIFVAARFLLRSVDCITLSYLLVASTDSIALFDGFRRLGIPKVFGMVITMTQRYLAVMLRVAEEIHLAKLSRTIVRSGLRREQKWAAAGIGILFSRTHRLAGEVHNAMISRGYDGDLQVSHPSSIRTSDILWFILCAAIAGALLVFDLKFAGSL